MTVMLRISALDAALAEKRVNGALETAGSAFRVSWRDLAGTPRKIGNIGNNPIRVFTFRKRMTTQAAAELGQKLQDEGVSVSSAVWPGPSWTPRISKDGIRIYCDRKRPAYGGTL